MSSKKEIVVKSNALVEARYRLSLQESHVVLWLLMQINQNDEDFKQYDLDISEFCKMVGVQADNRYTELRKITRRLLKRIIEIEEDNGNILQAAWLGMALYRKRKGVVSLAFSPVLKPYLLQLKKNFTKIGIADVMKLRSVYSVRIFEILLQYLTLGRRIVSVKELREYCSIDEKEYERYNDMKRKVIERAKTEINAKTPYEIDYKEIKESRKVVAHEWTIKHVTAFAKEQKKKVANMVKEIAKTKRKK